jgi:acyl dehydratase
MRYYEDFKVHQKLVTRGRTITEADIVNFAAFSGDWYPLHTDAEYAKKTPFGERVAHGMLTLAASTGLVPLYDMAIVALYGMDKIRFMKPTKIGDTIHVEQEIIELQDKGDNGVVSTMWHIKNHSGEDMANLIVKFLIAKAPTK